MTPDKPVEPMLTAAMESPELWFRANSFAACLAKPTAMVVSAVAALAETRRRDEAHEAEKQALRAERDEARQLADGYRRQFDSAEECARNHDVRATAARADADALRALLREARFWLDRIVPNGPPATLARIDAALGGKAAPCGGTRCHKADDGSWIHSSKSYSTCSEERAAPHGEDHE